MCSIPAASMSASTASRPGTLAWMSAITAICIFASSFAGAIVPRPAKLRPTRRASSACVFSTLRGGFGLRGRSLRGTAGQTPMLEGHRKTGERASGKEPLPDDGEQQQVKGGEARQLEGRTPQHDPSAVVDMALHVVRLLPEIAVQPDVVGMAHQDDGLPQ